MQASPAGGLVPNGTRRRTTVVLFLSANLLSHLPAPRDTGDDVTPLLGCHRNWNGELTAACNTQAANARSDSSVRRESDAVARRNLDPYVDTRCAVPDVTFARTWRNGNAVLMESRPPRDHPLPSGGGGATRRRVGVTTSRRSTVYENLPPSATARRRNRCARTVNERASKLETSRFSCSTETTKSSPREVAGGYRSTTAPGRDFAEFRGRIGSRAAVCRSLRRYVCVNLRVYTCMCAVSACARLHTHT